MSAFFLALSSLNGVANSSSRFWCSSEASEKALLLLLSHFSNSNKDIRALFEVVMRKRNGNTKCQHCNFRASRELSVASGSPLER